MIYKLLTAFLLGMVAGIFLWEKWGVGDEYKAYIKKIKSRGRGNEQEVIFTPIVGSASKSRREVRLEKKAARKAAKDEKKD